MNDDLPQVTVSPARKAFLSNASFVWLLPILALALALWVAWTTYSDRGPLIMVEFENGAGISAGETELRYRDVTVGVVESVGFSAGLDRVIASIRVEKEVAPFIDTGSVFWIVEPEVTAQGITGLSTVLSGVYIEGSWDDDIGPPKSTFQGVTSPPLIRPGRGGLQIALRTTAEGTLTDNAPILYRGIEVGRVGRAQINPNNNTAIAEALIFDEHRSLINESTRFWDASGFTVTIGPAGAEIDFSSLATLVGGGVTFDTFVSGGNPAGDGLLFDVFADKETARNSVFNASEGEGLRVAVVFDENISGLAVGAAVELSGLRIGEVETLSGVIDFDQFGDSRVRLRANLSLQPARLGLTEEANTDAALNFLRDRVENGLRARLASASLLTGGLKVELVTVEDAPPAALREGELGIPILPTTQNETTDTAATVEGVFTRINNLPVEELLQSAISFLNAAEALVANEDLNETPTDVRLLLAEVSSLVASDDVRNIPTALNATLVRVEALVAELEEQRLAARLVSALDAVTQTTAAVGTAVEGVPQLLTDLSALAQKAEELALEELVAEASELIASAEALLAAEATTAIPGEVRDALATVNLTLEELRAGGLVPNLNQTLASARIAVGNVAETSADLPRISARLQQVLDEAAAATANIDTAMAGVPELVERIQNIATKAEELPVEDLLTELTELTRSADALLQNEDVAAVPGALKRALDEVNFALQELREGGVIENVNRTLASARNAADTVALSVEDLPSIVTRLNGLLNQASRTIEGYNRGDELSRSAQQTLRDIQKAADALASLARTIERNPNSLLLGR